MTQRLALLAACVLLAACNTPTQADIDAATPFLFPNVRYIDAPRWNFSAAERERALQDFEAGDADTLFEFVVDADGRVRKVRVLRTHVKKTYRDFMLDHARHFEFTPDPRQEKFRAFFYPTNYRFESEFDWL